MIYGGIRESESHGAIGANDPYLINLSESHIILPDLVEVSEGQTLEEAQLQCVKEIIRKWRQGKPFANEPFECDVLPPVMAFRGSPPYPLEKPPWKYKITVLPGPSSPTIVQGSVTIRS